MAVRGNEELWIISILSLFTGLVSCYSPCYTQATTNSVPVALLCYDNQISGGSVVVIDGYRAKDSSTTNCQCSVSSHKPSRLNFTNYNGNYPGKECGSTLRIQADGTSIPMNCFVTDNQLPINGSDVNINLENPQLASNTDYCISIVSVDSTAKLNVSCYGDMLPSTTTTQFPPTTEQEETSSSSLTTGGQITTSTIQSSVTTIQVTTTSSSLSTAAQNLSTSTQSSATTEVITLSLSTASQSLPTSSQAATTSTEALLTSEATSTDDVSSSSSSQTVTTSADMLTTQAYSVSSGQTTDIDTTTEEMTTDNDVTTNTPESTTGNNVEVSTTAPTQTSEHKTTKNMTDLTTAPSQTSEHTTTTIKAESKTEHFKTSESVTAQNLSSTTTGQVSTQPMTFMSSTIVSSAGGIQNTTTTKRTTPVTPVITTSKPLLERGTPWSGIIPAILLGIILLVALVLAFVKWQRSREIKYPKDNESISIDKYPSIGEANFGYDAYDEGPEFITEFTKSPEEFEIDGIVLSNSTTDDVEPRNITEGPFVRYNVKDYRTSGNIPKYSVVNRGTQNGPDIYF
ncbi:mucin-5AC-like [Saccostrea echinata]|uniref:mucin-5AC-like n=1 Tax=Saccostrea echinata TaxID=191078 RepID=UPI002A7FB7EA|nr:mucin-5AC-like [Saccostrea echinata]